MRNVIDSMAEINTYWPALCMHVYVFVKVQCPTFSGWVQRSRIKVFPFLVQTDVVSDDELLILP